MRCTILIAVLLLSACQKKQEPPREMPLAGELYASVKNQLDLTTIETVTQSGVTIHMTRFKGNPDRIYATSEKGVCCFPAT